MIKLTVVRHGESEGNVKGIIDDNSSPATDTNNLSEKGKLEAIHLVEKLEGKNFDIIIVSKFKRTIQTLEPFLQNKKVKLIYSDLIAERNAGIFVGQNKSAIKEYCIKNNIVDRVNFRPENGESLMDVYKRAKLFLEYLNKNFQNNSILLCGHVNFLKCLDMIINNYKIEDFYSIQSLENIEIKEYNLEEN